MKIKQLIKMGALAGVCTVTLGSGFSTFPLVKVQANEEAGAVEEDSIISIKDGKLQEAIKLQLNIGDREIFRSDIEQLIELDASNLRIQTLEGLETAVNLKTADLSMNEVTDITPLVLLPILEKTNLAGNPLNENSETLLFTLFDKGIDVQYKNGWLQLDDRRYYMTSSGLAKGWLQLNDEWYYFSDKGMLETGWVEDKGKWYFLSSDGIMKTGWVKENENWYFLNSKGYMENGWIKDNNKWYFLHSSGKMQTGWMKDSGKWYFLKSDGAMKTGWVNDKGSWYFLRSNGVMETGWSDIGGSWYFFSNEGKMRTGWQKVDGDWYYLQSSGNMLTGWKWEDNKWYFLKPSGKMAEGWFQDGDAWYYAYQNGALAQNTEIDGYYVGYSGKWIKSTSYPYYLQGILLVNKFHSLPSSYSPGESPDARNAFNQMKTAASNNGITLKAFSTYRSYQYQETLYNRYVSQYGQEAADRFSAKPGKSEHQTGLAFDIGGTNSAHWAEDSFANTSEAKWLANNAHRFGFILRYPKGKEPTTGYQYESWHFRYVGVNHATKIYNNGLTLEEYLGEY
jgi:glucan-binding YG repeat protein